MSTFDSANKSKKDKAWDDEDEDDGVKDNWEDEEDASEGEEESEHEEQVPATKQKSEKDAVPETKAADDKSKAEDTGKKIEPTVATDSSEAGKEAKGQIDLFEPANKEQFEKFNEMLRLKITAFENSPFYVGFLENLFRSMSTNMEADDVKKLLSTISAVSNEKMKQQKTGKGKKKSKKASLAVGKDVEKDEIGENDYDEFDDFI